MERKLFILFAFVLIVPTSNYSQIVNAGRLVVVKGTDVNFASDFVNMESGEVVNDGDVHVFDNWTNDGFMGYLEEGTVYFQGNGMQGISGNKTTYMHNVVFSNGGEKLPFQLSGEISVANQAMFEMGIVNNIDFGGHFVFEEKAGHILTSNKSHVAGKVIKMDGKEFTFPVGDQGYYRGAKVEMLESPLISIESSYHMENPNGLYPLDKKYGVVKFINNKEYWRIETLVQEESEMLVTLSWNEAITPIEIYGNPEDIRIVRWDEEQEMWMYEGGSVNENEKTVTATVDDLGVYTLASINSDIVLPCGLVVYNAVTPNDDGKNDYFRIDNLVNNDCVSNAHVQVFNRWGSKVYETMGYGSSGNVFDGYTKEGTVLNRGKQLPSGTYFYVLDFEYSDGTGAIKKYEKSGYLYLNGNENEN